ncbi:MAG: DUF1015 domain-containing protein [Acidobacteriota bacterium]|nr:DUF1015 domain-containing protein [Acidobacteriota bacterium]
MANVNPFQPYRYSAKAGDPGKLITQPYDKINPRMQALYLAASPYNLVRVILGDKRDSDSAVDNVYTRAARYFEDWIQQGILAQDPVPGFYAYFQDFEVPDTGERLTRKGFIGLGKVEDYSAGIVFRHEQTLSGPKKDRLEVLRHTRAHFGQIFMLYPDREGSVDDQLDQATQGPPAMDVIDEYGARHRLWAVTDPARLARIQTLMQPMKLLIADGHHRYETALNYRNEHPGDPAAQYVMMTFVNMYSPGLKILATHRVLRGLENPDLLRKVTSEWTVKTFPSLAGLKQEMASPAPQSVRFGVVTAKYALLLSRLRKEGELDVPVLHREILDKWLGIGEEAVRDEKYIQYVRGMDAAAAEVREHGAQMAFLLDPTPIDDMGRVAFASGVMPQKSTDFYPKLLTGVTIYRL